METAKMATNTRQTRVPRTPKEVELQTEYKKHKGQANFALSQLFILFS